MTLEDALQQLRELELNWTTHIKIRGILEKVYKTTYERGKCVGRDNACDEIRTLVRCYQFREPLDDFYN